MEVFGVKQSIKQVFHCGPYNQQNFNDLGPFLRSNGSTQTGEIWSSTSIYNYYESPYHLKIYCTSLLEFLHSRVIRCMQCNTEFTSLFRF
jgi:hypothetical protein